MAIKFLIFICSVCCVHRPLLSLLAALPGRAQTEQLVLVAEDGLPQAGALLLHPSQQPLQLLDALAAPLADVLGTAQLLPLVIQLRPQPAAFSLRGENGMLKHQGRLVRLT